MKLATKINRLGFWLFIAIAFPFIACSDDKTGEEEVNGETKFEVEDIIFEGEKGEQEVTFTFEAGNSWTISFSNGGNAFYSATPTSGGAGKASVTVKPLRDNAELLMRTTELRVLVDGVSQPYTVKISQKSKAQNINIDKDHLILKADASGEFFVDTVLVTSSYKWDLSKASEGLLFKRIVVSQTGNGSVEKLVVMADYKAFKALKMEGGFSLGIGEDLRAITLEATSTCKAYVNKGSKEEVTKFEFVTDPASPGSYMVEMYVLCNVQWKIEGLPKWLTTLCPTNLSEDGKLEKDSVVVRIQIPSEGLSIDEKNTNIILKDVRGDTLISIPAHFAGVGDYLNHHIEFPAFDSHGNDFAFDPLKGIDKVVELPFLMETSSDYPSIEKAPFKMILCKSESGTMKRSEVHWSTLHMGDASKNKIVNGIYNKELYITANNRGDADDMSKITSFGVEREAYLFIVPKSVGFNDLFVDATSATLKSQYIGTRIIQKNGLVQYKMSVTGIENKSTITVPATGKNTTYKMITDAVKVVTEKMDITEELAGKEDPISFDPKDVLIDFPRNGQGIADLTKLIVNVGKNKAGRERTIRVNVRADRGTDSDGTDNLYTMFTFYIKQPK
ncbi:MAG: hypothetical protein RSA44_00675 [Bacteroides sp.]